MSFKSTFYFKIIILLCILCLCLILLPYHITKPTVKNNIVSKPPDEVCSINEDLTQACIADDSTKEEDNKLTNDNKIKTKTEAPYTIVTAASANHFCALEAMLYIMQDLKQIVTPGLFPRIVVYSLGILPEQEIVLKNLHQHDYFDELIEFDYSKYPIFWNVSVNRGEYAWKPGAVKEIQEKYSGVIIWLDTGDVPNKRFIETIPSYVKQHGFWSPRSTGLMGAKFNHIGLFQYYKTSKKMYASKENCNGAVLGFDASNPKIVETLIQPWFDCALDKDCIAPKGSSRVNHRQDQSAISFLALRAGYQCFEYPEFHGLTIHQDDFCNQRLALLYQSGDLLTPSSYIKDDLTSI
ncbi:unnamed protein product [Cunninghamella blakesleeana]